MITASVDGEKVFEHQDSALSAGTIGFDGINVEYYVDDIKVSRQRSENPSASVESGRFTEPFNVKLNASESAVIVYTTDGSEPVGNGIVYDKYKGIDIKETTTLKFAAVEKGKIYSDVITCEYTFEASEPANKTLLQKAYDYALTLSTDGVTDSAKKAFEDALANAETILAKADATQEEVNAAMDRLFKGIWGLGVVQGDKAMLNLLIERADAMITEKDRYVETNWQQLVDALAAAKDVSASGDATQDIVDEAADNLLNAILAQRYKANKDNLNKLIEQAEGLDLSKYTKESVAAFKAALKNAKAVQEDSSLSEDDQEKVDQAEKELKAAIDGLKLAEGDGNNTGNSGNDGNNNSSTGAGGNNDTGKGVGKDAPKTGDSSNMALWIMLMTAATAGISVRRRKKT